MSDKGEGRSGGVNIEGPVGSVGGDIVGRDKIIGAPSPAQVDSLLRILEDVIKSSSPEKRSEAGAKLAALKVELSKGKDANDSLMAKLMDGLVALVPAAAGALISAFATPILGGIAGPVTAYALEKLRGK